MVQVGAPVEDDVIGGDGAGSDDEADEIAPDFITAPVRSICCAP